MWEGRRPFSLKDPNPKYFRVASGASASLSIGLPFFGQVGREQELHWNILNGSSLSGFALVTQILRKSWAEIQLCRFRCDRICEHIRIAPARPFVGSNVHFWAEICLTACSCLPLGDWIVSWLQQQHGLAFYQCSEISLDAYTVDIYTRLEVYYP